MPSTSDGSWIWRTKEDAAPAVVPAPPPTVLASVAQLFLRNWREVVYVGVRLAVFTLVQLLLRDMARFAITTSTDHREFPMANALLVTSYCWMLLGGMRLAYAVCAGVLNWCWLCRVRRRQQQLLRTSTLASIEEEEEEEERTTVPMVIVGGEEVVECSRRSLWSHVQEHLWPSPGGGGGTAVQFSDGGRVSVEAAEAIAMGARGRREQEERELPSAVWAHMHHGCGVVLFVVSRRMRACWGCVGRC